MKRSTALIVLLMGAVLVAPLTATAAGRIELGDEYPVIHKSTLIHVRDASGKSIEGALIDITYRPESQVEKTVTVGTTNNAGIVRWTPEDVGVVTISAAWTEEDSTAGTATSNISVKFASLPVDGIAIMIFAGLLLLGGSIIRFTRLLREGDGT